MCSRELISQKTRFCHYCHCFHPPFIHSYPSPHACTRAERPFFLLLLLLLLVLVPSVAAAILSLFCSSSPFHLSLLFFFLFAGVAIEEEKEAATKQAAKKNVFRCIIVTCKSFLVFFSLLFSSVWCKGSSFSSMTSLLSSSLLRFSLSFDLSPRFCSFPQIQLEREL